MIHKHKKYSRPKRPFDKLRIEEEAKIKKEYGLKNKKEIWKAEANVKLMREKAKRLISASPEEQEALFERMKKIGIKVNSISDILALDKKNYLEQRLQTILVRKMMVRTMKSARQLITHKKVLVDGKIINSPSYIVPVEFRDKISLKISKKKSAKEKIAEADASGDSGLVNNKKEEDVKQGAQKDEKITNKKISSEVSEKEEIVEENGNE